MANRFIGSVVSSNTQSKTSFSSRSSAGTYFDKNGLLVTATSNQPRLNYSFVNGAWTQPAVLIEPASTNIVSFSQDFSQVAYWTLNNSTVGSTAGTAPDGTNTAFKIQENTSNSLHGVEEQLGDTNGRAYTLSIFAKAAERSWLIVDNTHQGVLNYRNWFNLSTGVTGTMASGNSNLTMTPVGNGWYRCSVTRPAGTLGSHRICIYATTGDGTLTYTGSSGSGILIWGCQLEYQLGMTSYINSPSTGVGTRAADIVGPGTSGVYRLEDRQNTTSTDDQFTVQSFTSTGSTTWTAPADVTSVEVLVVAGGGGGGSRHGGGGGAGGLIYNSKYAITPGNTYSVVVGAGGAGAPVGGSTTGSRGLNSQFDVLVAIGGGPGTSASEGGNAGGSGGGGRGNSTGAGGEGIAGQGNAGGAGTIQDALNLEGIGGGGGGAGGPGIIGRSGGGFVGGGPGLFFNISGSSVAYAGGGGAGGTNDPGLAGGSLGGVGGGGNGNIGSTSSDNATSGAANTGGGGGAGGHTGGTNYAGKSGGSGIVIIKYKRTPKQLVSTSNAAIVVQRFTTSNVWTVPAGVTSVEALVVAGGGGGGNGTAGGGGGAGGVVYNSALAVTPGSTYTVGVGGGGLGAGDAGSPPAYNGFGSGIGTGSELITNGTGFTATTGWSATTATLSVPVSGVFRIVPNISVNGTASQSITTVNGVTYVAVVRVINDITKNFRLRIGTTQVSNDIADFFTSYTRDSLDNGASGAGFYSMTFTAIGSTTWINMQIGGGGGQATDITYISVRQASLPAVGGGAGGSESGTASVENGSNGGSGGGAAFRSGKTAGTGVAGQGNAGGIGFSTVANLWTGGGGGGAVSTGGNATAYYPGYGGSGAAYAITGNLEYYGGGGGGSSQNNGVGTVYPGLGGVGGGGTGAADQTSSTIIKGGDGAPNTGGGGGAQANATGSGNSGHGGSGVVILRYRVPQVATFLDSGSWTCPAGVTSVQALIVAGGGGGGAGATGSQLGGGGAGAGGLIYDNSIPVTPGVTYPIIVGQGGFGGVTGTRSGTTGQNSSFSNLIAVGGGFGGVRSVSEAGGSGGSGGAGAGNPAAGGTATFGQGNIGAGSQLGGFGGGGGGAGAVGSLGQATTEPTGGSGGIGLQFSIGGTATFYASGGSSGAWGGDQIVPATSGGGGAGGATRNSGFAGAPNTGGGGGGGGSGYRNVSADTAATGNGAIGGSGIVIIRWIGG